MLPVRDQYRRAFSLIICAIFGIQFAWSFHQAWTHTESDFPSYYTAAHLVAERKPLRDFYDMARFQEHMDAFVVPNRLGGYIPQTPLTMLPFVPLVNLAMQDAKRLWLLIDVAFLSGTVWLLARMTNFGLSEVLGLLVLGFGALHTNLQLGQYYVFLLFLLTLAGYFLATNREFASGGTLGLICSLKLITLPFILYFAWRRQWKALAGMCVALGVSCLVALALFGESDLKYYLGAIWPRSMAGETLDPFNAANGTVVTLLRHMLVREPELNPAALFDSPVSFFFLQAFFGLSTLFLSLLAFGRASSFKLSYAGFLVTLILLSPNTASYTFLLLLLPTALLLESASGRYKAILLFCYILLALPMRPSWSWLFPKVWLLIAMFWSAWAVSGRSLRPRTIVASLSVAAAISLFIGVFGATNHGRETHRRWQHIAGQPGEVYSSHPIPMNDGLVYQAIKDGVYKLRYRRGGAVQDLVVKGNALSPELLSRSHVLRFESIRGGINHRFIIDPDDRGGVAFRQRRSYRSREPGAFS